MGERKEEEKKKIIFAFSSRPGGKSIDSIADTRTGGGKKCSENQFLLAFFYIYIIFFYGDDIIKLSSLWIRFNTTAGRIQSFSGSRVAIVNCDLHNDDST